MTSKCNGSSYVKPAINRVKGKGFSIDRTQQARSGMGNCKVTFK